MGFASRREPLARNRRHASTCPARRRRRDHRQDRPARALVAKLAYSVGKDPIVASNHDWFMAAALTVRDRIVDRWFPSTRAIYTEKRKRVYYLSLEFLIGRLLSDGLNNLGLTETMRAALAELGVDPARPRAIR